MALSKQLITLISTLILFSIESELVVSVLPIPSFFGTANKKKKEKRLIKWLILDRLYSFYSSGASIRRSYVSEYSRSRTSPAR